jgi:hypothetical protein
MSRPSSRQDAARQGAAQAGTGPGLREWLAGVRLDGVRSAAAFDTRVTPHCARTMVAERG